MDEFYYRPADGSQLQRMWPGDTVTIDGEEKRVGSVAVRPAEEDDPELGVKAGDLIYIVALD